MGGLFRKSEEKFCLDGAQLLASGKLKWAETEYLKGLEAYPKSGPIWSNLANVYITAKEWTKAISALTSGLVKIAFWNQDRWAAWRRITL